MAGKKVSVLLLAVFLSLKSADAGVSFIRWGRQECPTGTILLYKGYMTGAAFNQGGSGSSYLCTHEQPQFVRGQPGAQGWKGGLYGVELEYADGTNQLLTDNIPDGTLHNEDMVCARCYVEGSSDQMMIPGRQDCAKTGYDLMYKGFLVSHHNIGGRLRNDYVCLDEAPEGRVGGAGNNDQGFAYITEFGCGSLPCNPFVDGMEVTCAVCTY